MWWEGLESRSGFHQSKGEQIKRLDPVFVLLGFLGVKKMENKTKM